MNYPTEEEMTFVMNYVSSMKSGDIVFKPDGTMAIETYKDEVDKIRAGIAGEDPEAAKVVAIMRKFRDAARANGKLK